MLQHCEGRLWARLWKAIRGWNFIKSWTSLAVGDGKKKRVLKGLLVWAFCLE